jgi:MFS family permease
VNKERLNVLAIYAVSFISMVSVAVSPALAPISKHFSWASAMQIQMLVTLPSLAMIPSALVSTTILKRYSIKSLFLANLAVAFLGGFLPLFLSNYYLILLLRVISGFSLGFIQILLSVTITTRIPEASQGKVMGGRTFFTSLGAMVFSYAGGMLADIDWHYSFLPFLLAVPIIAVTAMFLQRMEPLPTTPSDEAQGRFKFDSVTVFICLFTVVHIIFLQTIITNVSLFIDAEGFGTATTAGIAVAIYNLSGLFCGFIMSKMYTALKGYSMVVCFISSCVGILMIGLSQNIVLVCIGCFFCGCGMASILGIGPLDITRTVRRENATRAISLFAIAIFFGSFLNPYVIIPMANVVREDSIRMRYLTAGIMLVLQTVTFEIVRRKRFQQYYVQNGEGAPPEGQEETPSLSRAFKD